MQLDINFAKEKFPPADEKERFKDFKRVRTNIDVCQELYTALGCWLKKESGIFVVPKITWSGPIKWNGSADEPDSKRSFWSFNAGYFPKENIGNLFLQLETECDKNRWLLKCKTEMPKSQMQDSYILKLFNELPKVAISHIQLSLPRKKKDNTFYLGETASSFAVIRELPEDWEVLCSYLKGLLQSLKTYAESGPFYI